MNQRRKLLSAVFIILVVAMAILLYFFLAKREPKVVEQTPTMEESVFGLANKEMGTKVYYSENLGVGFTYLPYSAEQTPTITEAENKISLEDQSIEVFTKDPSLSLEEAIKSKFLQGFNESECFVKNYEASEQELANYISAGISYPPTEDPNAPFWQNSDKCPESYSETNGIQYFLMNKDVPGKFVFVRVGQYSAASDGTPRTPESGFNWTHSIRILK